MEPIKGFVFQHRWLSNFFPSYMEIEGIIYSTAEHAYQACKTNDKEEKLRISRMISPGQAKRAGRKITLRPDWEQVKEEMMALILEKKFEHLGLREQLLATGDAELEETNNWGDTYWGVCQGVGQNRLGVLLMELRAKLAANA